MAAIKTKQFVIHFMKQGTAMFSMKKTFITVLLIQSVLTKNIFSVQKNEKVQMLTHYDNNYVQAMYIE